MTKKSRKRRVKPDDPFALAPTPRREADGRPERGPSAYAETLATRSQMHGISQDAAREPWWGCIAGKAMAQATATHAKRLIRWDAIQHARRVAAAYDRSLHAPRRHAKTANILAPVDAMETDAAAPPMDSRTDDDKAAQARSSWQSLQHALHHAQGGERAVMDCAVNDMPCYDPPSLMRGLDCIADLIAGRPVAVRLRAG
jgi:hypothetical protein